MSTDPTPTSETVAWGGGPAPWGAPAAPPADPPFEAPPRWRAFGVIGAFLLLVTLAAGAGIAIGQREDDPATTTATSPEAPAVGACRTYDAREGLAETNESAVVPCAGPHSAQTFAVADTLPDPGETGWTEEQVQDAARVPCSTEAAARALGLSNAEFVTKRIGVFFFVANAEQARAGARWVRCDAVVLNGARAVEIEGDLIELVKIDGAFTRCVSRLNAFVATVGRCTGSATQRAAIAAVDIGPDSDIDDRRELGEECRREAQAASDVATPNWEVSASDPTVNADGEQFATCWLPVGQWNVDRSAWPAERPFGGTTGSPDSAEPPSGEVLQA